MSTTVLDERSQRRAQSRAQAAAIADAPRATRRFVVHPGVHLRPSPRRRSTVRQRVPVAVRHRPPSSLRRLVALAALVIQLTLLLLALTLPAFQVRAVDVSGTHLLSANEVIGAAAVPRQSIFTVDGDAIRSRVLSLPWVQTASVTVELPARVRIAVVERTPTLRIRRGGADSLVADNGAVLSGEVTTLPAFASVPVLLDDRTGSAQPVAPAVLQLMDVTDKRFRAVFGCEVAAFQWDPVSVFSIWCSTGWRAVLGHLDSSEAVAGVPAQLAALAALRGQLDLVHPAFGYVDLVNPAAPAVGGTRGLPAEVLAAKTPLPALSPLPPAPAPVAAPAPSSGQSPSAPTKPTPYTFTITPPPGPSPHGRT